MKLDIDQYNVWNPAGKPKSGSVYDAKRSTKPNWLSENILRMPFSIKLLTQVFLHRKTVQVLGDVISQSCMLGWSSCSLSDLFNLTWIQSFITFVFHHPTLTPSVAMAARQSGVFVRYIRQTSQLFDFCRIKSIVLLSSRLRIMKVVVSFRVSMQ